MNVTVFRQMYELMYKKSVIHAALWLKSRDEFGEEWEQELSLNIARVFGETHNPLWEEAINGYISFCNDALRAQAFFEKNGRYKASNYAECVESCYRSENYMKLRYLPGQYLSHYIWPHHQRMLRHYCEKLIPLIRNQVKLFFEVGVGCGMYSQKTLELMPDAAGIGFDISDYSLEFTYRVAAAHGFAQRYQVRNSNIIVQPPAEHADFVICQEVLEHLEDPENLIKALFEATRQGGFGYITAAVNAAHTDHIYHYHSPDEVRRQIEKIGWEVLDAQIEENNPEKPKETRPTIAGFLVKKEA